MSTPGKPFIPAIWGEAVKPAWDHWMSMTSSWLVAEREGDMTEEAQTKLSDLIPIECETTLTEYIARLAWDKAKCVAIQRVDAPSFADEILLGLLWQNYAQEILKHIQNEPRNATPLGAIDDRLHRIENALRYLGECGGESLLDQAGLAQTIARLDRQVRRINTEIFATRITRHSGDGSEHDKRRQTLLGRVDELSGMAALGDVDQSWFLE